MIEIMDPASKILVVGGMVNLLVGFVTGVPYVVLQARGQEVSKYLRFVHVGGFLQAPLLFGLVIALQLSALSDRVELAGASLMVATTLVLLLKDTLNWLGGVKNELAEKSIGGKIGILIPLLGFPAVGIFSYGVFTGL